jgi:hypothetical protein
MIPEKIKIGYLEYDINTTDKILVLNARECSGLIHYEDVIIEINSIRSIQSQEQIFWHEILHGIINDRDIELGENEEKIIDNLAKGIYALMKDNPFPLPGQVIPCEK